MFISQSMMQICTVVRFLERVSHCEMKWTQESVKEFIETLYKKINNMRPKAPNAF